MSTTLEETAEALFCSCLQASQHPTMNQIASAVQTMLGTYGPNGCAATVAQEFGEHPEIAVSRMSWALTAVHEALEMPAMQFVAA
jgi:hypothetical protein